MRPWETSQLSNAYKEHTLFAELVYMIDLYECLSNRAYCFLQTRTKEIFNYQAYCLMAIQGTLESINMLLKTGRMNDAIVLIRKMYDDVVTWIYLDVRLRDEIDFPNELYVKDVVDWIENDFRIPSIKQLLKVIKDSPHTRDLFSYFDWDGKLKSFRQFLDDSVHSNNYDRILFNCNTVYLEDKREKLLDQIAGIFNQLMTLQIAFVFHLDSHYMMASDYMDALEMGCQPEEGSERWVAPFAQKAFDKYIRPNKPLAEFIKKHCCLEIA